MSIPEAREYPKKLEHPNACPGQLARAAGETGLFPSFVSQGTDMERIVVPVRKINSSFA